MGDKSGDNIYEDDANNERLNYLRTPIINTNLGSSFDISPIGAFNSSSQLQFNAETTQNNLNIHNSVEQSKLLNKTNSHQKHSLCPNIDLNPGFHINTSTPIIHYRKLNLSQHHMYNLQEQASLSPIPPPGFLKDFSISQQLTPNFTASGISYHHKHHPVSADFLYAKQPEQFPESFDPRSAANMPHKEKVNEWIARVPIYCLADGQIWYNECYPGAVPTSSSISTEVDSVDEFDMFNYNQRLFGNDLNQEEQLYVDRDDVLEFQARRITKYVKKIYKMDSSEVVVKGDQQLIVIEPERTQYSNGEHSESNLQMTNTSYNLDLSESFDQANRKKTNKYKHDRIDDEEPNIDLLNNTPQSFIEKDSFLNDIVVDPNNGTATPRKLAANRCQSRVNKH